MLTFIELKEIGQFTRSVSRNMATFASLAAMSTLAGPSAARSETFVVQPDGLGDYPTIQAAIDAAESGDEILLTAGTFVGPGNNSVNIVGKYVTIRSVSGDPRTCTIDCEGEGGPALIYGDGFKGGGGGVLDGVRITGADVPSAGWINYAVLFTSNANGTIRNCLLEENLGGAIAAAYYCWPIVENCEIRGNGRVGILSSGNSNVTVRGCVITGNGRDGIEVYSGYATVEDCTIAANGRHGLLVESGSCTITRTVVWGNCGSYPADIALVQGNVLLECCVYNADEVGGDGSLNPTGQNFSQDPRFCDATECVDVPSAQGYYRVWASSICLPENNECGVLIGARNACDPTTIVERSWGSIKAHFK